MQNILKGKTIRSIYLNALYKKVYYISTTGNDATATGTQLLPFKTLYGATTAIKTAGSLLVIAAGTYNETLPSNLAAGVSIRGEGKATTIINNTYNVGVATSENSGGAIQLHSATAGTLGAQSISKITLTGANMVGSRGIIVKNRSNVSIFDCEIKDFFVNGVTFMNSGIFIAAPPAVYEKDNALYDCIITNCGDTPGTWNGGGLVLISCQENLKVYNNTFSAILRAKSHNGNIFNAGGRHFKNLKYYNNSSTKSNDEGNSWNFHLEFWNIEGGMEIYNNTFTGGDCAIDLGGSACIPTNYGYSARIYNNVFQQPVGHGFPQSYHPRTAITVESYDTKDVEIFNNEFNNWPSIFSIEDEPSIVCDVRRVSFNHNLVNLQGWGNGIYFAANYIQCQKVGNYMSDISIVNNTFFGDKTGRISAIDISVGSKSGNTPIAGGTMERVNIINNIFVHHTNGAPLSILNNGILNNLQIENNLFYNEANSNIMPSLWAYNSGTFSGYSFTNNIPLSNVTQQLPQFVSPTDFHLQANSPAINTGKDVGFAFTGIAPDMGYSEFI